MRPRDVPGYEQARLAGLLPVVPSSPPERLRGPSAVARCVAVVVVFVAGTLVLLVLPEPTFAVALGGIAVTLLLVGLLSAFMIHRHLAEVDHGYFTLPIRVGAAPVSSPADHLRRHARVPWDFSSIWALTSGGKVKRPPTSQDDPPGYYPSPTRTGRMEYWTGAAWTGTLQGR